MTALPALVVLSRNEAVGSDAIEPHVAATPSSPEVLAAPSPPSGEGGGGFA